MEKKFKIIKKIIAGAMLASFCAYGMENVSTSNMVSRHEKIMYTGYTTEGESTIEDTTTGENITTEDTTNFTIEDESIYNSTYISYGEGCFFVSLNKENFKNTNAQVTDSQTENLMNNTGIASTQDLINACFSAEEIDQVAAGVNAELQIDIKFIEPETLNQKKYSLMMNALEQYRQEFSGSSEFNITDYVKITMNKKNTLGEWEKITKFNNPVDIMLDIPKESQFLDAEHYYLIQLQGNKSYTLKEDTDSYGELLSVPVTGSSICAIAYTKEILEPIATVVPTERPTFWKQLNDSKLCLWHWFNISFLIIGLTWILAVERNKNRMIFTIVMSVINVVLAIMGSCKWDWIILIISLFIMWIANVWKISRKNK